MTLALLVTWPRPLVMRDWSLKPDSTVEKYLYSQNPVMDQGLYEPSFVEFGEEVMANCPELGLHITIHL